MQIFTMNSKRKIAEFVNTVQTLYKGLEGTVKCCLLYQVDLISGVLKISLFCTKIPESVLIVIILERLNYSILDKTMIKI